MVEVGSVGIQVGESSIDQPGDELGAATDETALSVGVPLVEPRLQRNQIRPATAAKSSLLWRSPKPEPPITCVPLFGRQQSLRRQALLRWTAAAGRSAPDRIQSRTCFR